MWVSLFCDSVLRGEIISSGCSARCRGSDSCWFDSHRDAFCESVLPRNSGAEYREGDAIFSGVTVALPARNCVTFACESLLAMKGFIERSVGQFVRAGAVEGGTFLKCPDLKSDDNGASAFFRCNTVCLRREAVEFGSSSSEVGFQTKVSSRNLDDELFSVFKTMDVSTLILVGRDKAVMPSC